MIIEIFLIFIAFSTICHSQPTPPPLVRNIAVGIGVVSSLVSYIFLLYRKLLYVTVFPVCWKISRHIQIYDKFELQRVLDWCIERVKVSHWIYVSTCWKRWFNDNQKWFRLWWTNQWSYQWSKFAFFWICIEIRYTNKIVSENTDCCWSILSRRDNWQSTVRIYNTVHC